MSDPNINLALTTGLDYMKILGTQDILKADSYTKSKIALQYHMKICKYLVEKRT